MDTTKLKVGKVKLFKHHGQSHVIGVVAISALAIAAIVAVSK